MAGICCGLVGESEAVAPVIEPSARSARRRRLELRPCKVVADSAVPPPLENGRKRQKLDLLSIPSEPLLVSSVNRKSSDYTCRGSVSIEETLENDEFLHAKQKDMIGSSSSAKSDLELLQEPPKYGMTSVCGRRRDMEDAVSIRTSFATGKSSFFGVFDGHGCSHVALKCKDRLHDIVKEEIESYRDTESVQWKETMQRSFVKLDKEVDGRCHGADTIANCRCELQTPQCDAVGSTAVVAVVTPEKIIVSNCGDSRAVLCRNGAAIPLSTDHKPDRPDELHRIQAAGGRVIYWDGARVLGVLAMSRAIGDNYLKPYVIPEPEVTVIERTAEDECLILASDGLWDVVTNETACGVARMCLRQQRPPSPPGSPAGGAAEGSSSDESSDKACSDASMLLTKLALARHSTDNVSVMVVDLRRTGH